MDLNHKSIIRGIATYRKTTVIDLSCDLVDVYMHKFILNHYSQLVMYIPQVAKSFLHNEGDRDGSKHQKQRKQRLVTKHKAA